MTKDALSDAQANELARIRDGLLATFTAQSFDDLFFYSSNSKLRLVRNQFALNDGLEVMVAKALEYCEKHNLVPDLLDEVDQARERQPIPPDLPTPRPLPPPQPGGPLTRFVRLLATTMKDDPLLTVLIVVALFLLLGILLVTCIPGGIGPKPSPTPADIPPSMHTDTPQPTPADTSSPTPTSTPSPTPTDTPLVRVESELNPCGPWRIPSNINPGQDPSSEAAQLFDLERDSLPTGPFRGGFLLTLNLTSISQDREWIELGNTASVSVQVHDDAPENANLWRVKECGGMGAVRLFSEGTLTADRETYTFSVTAPEADYFSLQPGEFEAFLFTFNCMEPGTYRISVEIPYKYKGESGAILFEDSRSLVCPQSYLLWEAYAPAPGGFSSGPLEYVGAFEWNGTGYETVD
jgi:hypothetical protein